jgi:hypothetical protein
MDFLSNPIIQGQANLSTPSFAVLRPQSLIQESISKETNLHASRARPNLEISQTSHSANPSLVVYLCLMSIHERYPQLVLADSNFSCLIWVLDCPTLRMLQGQYCSLTIFL